MLGGISLLVPPSSYRTNGLACGPGLAVNIPPVNIILQHCSYTELFVSHSFLPNPTTLYVLFPPPGMYFHLLSQELLFLLYNTSQMLSHCKTFLDSLKQNHVALPLCFYSNSYRLLFLKKNSSLKHLSYPMRLLFICLSQQYFL